MTLETDDLDPRPTLHSYINDLLKISGEIMAVTRGTVQYSQVDELTSEMDMILIEMRHADWKQEIG